VDARLHHVQGKAKLVSSSRATSSGTVELLIEFYREKLQQLLEHQAHARHVSQYDANNTYQYIVNREDVQLTWLAKAIADGGGAVPDAPTAISDARGNDAAALFSADAKAAAEFIARWRPRVDAMEHARHQAMLRVILGETREQQRFFEQALAGRTDLLGRRASAAGPSHGDVLPARWIE
jgi:hypothetical protein